MSKLFVAAKYNQKINAILNIDFKYDKIYQSTGLKTHLIKKGHIACLQYLDKIAEIVENPDYVGVNPNEKGKSIELVKRYEENILVGIKLDQANDYLYVATLHEVSQAKVERRLHSGRFLKYE
jgi:hypothetical protein